MTVETTFNDITALLERACADGHVDGASVAFIQGGRTFEASRGFANKVEDIPATPETLFHIGSVTKSLTAELVWELIGDGKLAADMPVIAAAPELSHIRSLSNERLTLARLLSHTGGIDGDVILDVGRDKDVLRRYMIAIRDIGSLFDPGSHFSYANIGYGILGRIVEIAGGAVFEDRLARLLREEHGLKHIGILPIEKIRQRTALHFTNNTPDYFGPHSNIASGTVLAMSMGDLARWGSHHLPGDSMELPTMQMCKHAISLPHNHRYEGWGYGFSLMDGLGETLFGHDGGTAGTGTFLRIAPRTGAAWALSATGNGAMPLYRKVEPQLRLMAGMPEAKRRLPPATPIPADLRVYEGIYVRHGMAFTISSDSDKTLMLDVAGGMAPALGALRLRPLSREVFEATIPALDATLWISFHEFDASERPHLLFSLERMARRIGDERQ